MENMNKFIIVAMIVLYCSLVYSEDPYITRPKNTYVNIVLPCSLDGGSCPANTDCNISLRYPNTSLLADRVSMSITSDLINYTMLNTSLAGDYPAYVICCAGDVCDEEYFIVRIGSGLTTNMCPQNISGMMSLYFVITLCILFILIAMIRGLGWLGILGSIGLLTGSWLIYGCYAFVGAITALISIVLILYFAFSKIW